MNSPKAPPDLDEIGSQALLEVLDTLLSLSATRLAPDEGVATATEIHFLRGTVPLIGKQVSGEVHLQVSKAFAAMVEGRLCGSSPAGPGVEGGPEDVIGELCNMIAGRVAACLSRGGFSATLDTPMVVSGPVATRAPDPGAAVCRTVWSCEGHWLAFEIHCRFQRHGSQNPEH